MTGDELRAIQGPLKDRFRADPASALAILEATGEVDFERIAVKLTTRPIQPPDPGLHPMTGGDGTLACAAEMLLQSLVGCAGVTLAAVCTSMGLPIQQAQLNAQGALDFRGTLGLDRQTPIGFTDIALTFAFRSDATDEQLAKAVQLAERYCVVAQTLKQVHSHWERIN